MIEFDYLLEKLHKAKNGKDFLFVGVSGLGNSGKTTLCKKINESIPDSITIHIDDFYKPSENRTDNHSSKEIISTCFDWERAQREIFEKIQEKKDIDYNVYNWDTDAIENSRNISLKGIIILEGLYIFQERFVDKYDLKIWVETPKEIREQRVQTRKMPEHFKKLWFDVWIPQDEYYLEKQKPHLVADYIISGA